MNIKLHPITIAELIDGYSDQAEKGVTAYGGRLDVRPPYQREFVYKPEQRNEVICSISRGFPINVMYWATHEDGTFEIIDGQQRTISIAQYIKGEFSLTISLDQGHTVYFDNLPKDRQDAILNYELQVYRCSGSPSERLNWFKTINIAGETFTPQELRNAVYHGDWLANAKTYFSRPNAPAANLARDYCAGKPIRQEFLETAIQWHLAYLGSGTGEDQICEYMGKRQDWGNAQELWTHFRSVIARIEDLFPKPNYRKEMKGVNWGALQTQMADQLLDPIKLEEEIKALMTDDSLKNHKGIYPYVLTRDERHLNFRAFDNTERRKAYERQGGKCLRCPQDRNEHPFEQMEADHIIPWSEGGKTEAENCQMLCRDCNRRKSNI